MLYRIYTEDKDRENIRHALKVAGIEGYTFFYGQGCWQGISEQSLIVEVIGPERPTKGKVKRAAEEIKRVNEQKEVLVTEQPMNFV